MKLGIIGKVPDSIIVIARQIRRKILATNGSPFGSCSDASCMLAKKLRQLGYDAHMISGKFVIEKGTRIYNPIRKEHCWVRIKKIIVDVTADQFNCDMNDTQMRAVVVGTSKQLQSRYKRKCCRGSI